MEPQGIKTIKSRVLLASNSARRRELLRFLVPDFGVAKMHDIDESYPSNLPASKIPEYLSKLKADAYREQLTDGEIIVTADTIVIVDDRVLGKPHSEDEAHDMLRMLSGRTHKVITGVTLTSTSISDTFSVCTEVQFDTLTDDEIRSYVDTFKPFDKAGAYGIQEWIGCIGISGIKGCFYNVMGLPLHALYHHLCDFEKKLCAES